jgi:hypothetical protein
MNHYRLTFETFYAARVFNVECLYTQQPVEFLDIKDAILKSDTPPEDMEECKVEAITAEEYAKLYWASEWRRAALAEKGGKKFLYG